MLLSSPICYWLLTLFLPMLCGSESNRLAKTHKNLSKRQTAFESSSIDENLVFSSPELIAIVTDPDGTELFLEAFKIKENDQILTEIPANPSKVGSLRFLSIGHPKIVLPKRLHQGAMRSETSAIVPTPLGFHFYVEMLPQTYREALAAVANTKFQTSVITQTQVVMLTPNSFTCTVTFATSDGLTTMVKGKVKTFRKNPVKVDFELPRSSPLYKELRSGSLTADAVVIHCEVIKRAQQAQTDQLIITSQQIDRLNLQNKLFGRADSVFVSRQQMKQLGREIIQNLNVFESYESGSGFEVNFVTDLLQHFGIQNAFSPRPIAEVLASLSPYNVNQDLRPEEIKKELSDVLKVETVGGKQHIVKNRESSQLQRESSNESGGASGSGGYGTFTASASANYAASKSGEWLSSGKSLDDQLMDINRNSQSTVKYERVGMKIVPKSMEVAQISRSAMSQSMTFSRIRRKLTSADFYREFELPLPHPDSLSTTAATTVGTTTISTSTDSSTGISTTATATTTRTKTSVRRQDCSKWSLISCQTSFDCCEWKSPDYKIIQSCGDDKKCNCIPPGGSCFGGLRCCDGSICNFKCPPTAQFHYCDPRFTLTPNCQSGRICTLDSVSLRIWPGQTEGFGRCL